MLSNLAPRHMRRSVCVCAQKPFAPSTIPVRQGGGAGAPSQQARRSPFSDPDARSRTASPQRDVSSSAAAGIPLRRPIEGACIVKMESSLTSSSSVTVAADGPGLKEYMARAADNFANVELPMGGNIRQMDARHLQITVPKIQILDIWLQPRLAAELITYRDRIEFVSKTDAVSLDGSSHVKQFKLDERFHMDVHIVLRWREDKGASPADAPTSGGAGAAPSTWVIDAAGTISVEVDIPPPFSYAPKSMLQATANAALKATNGLILNSFIDSMAKDYARWAADAAGRRGNEEAELAELRALAVRVLEKYEERLAAGRT